MVKKINSYKDIQCGDIILLYGASENGKVVQKKYFKIESNQDDRENSVVIWSHCYIVREDGSYIKDRWGWGNKKHCSLYFHKFRKVFTCNDGTFNLYYADPKIPCEQVIKRLREEKRKINKKIVDCQNYMYKII